MSSMDDLMSFLRAQLDDDERVAQAAAAQLLGEPQARWIAYGEHLGAHIARWDPARVLAEIEAIRRILDAGTSTSDPNRPDDKIHFGTWKSCSDECPNIVWEQVVRLLAQPYAGRDGWREQWRADV